MERDGGAQGLRDEGQLESAVYRRQSGDYSRPYRATARDSENLGKKRMASFVSRLLKGLTGGSSAGDAPAERGEAVAYKDLVIHAAPVREGQQWRVAGVILKQSGDGELERAFTRADTVATREEAETLSVSKARQIIDQRGADLFADGEATGRA